MTPKRKPTTPRKLPIRDWHDKVRKILWQEALDRLKQAERAGGRA